MLPNTDMNGVAILGVGHLFTAEERFMDIATIVGLLAAFGLIFMAISEKSIKIVIFLFFAFLKKMLSFLVPKP